MENKLILKLFPLENDDFIGSINQIEAPKQSQAIETVIIFDQTNLTHSEIKRFSNEIIPLFLKKLNYESHQMIHSISFDANFHLYSMSSDCTKATPAKVQGSTKSSIHEMCQQILRNFEKNTFIRLLMISTGNEANCDDIEAFQGNLEKFCKFKNFSIDSQAIRVITATNKPDPRSFFGILRINNSSTPKFCDIFLSETNQDNASKMADLFKENILTVDFMVKDKVLMKFPWETLTSQLKLKPGNNVFWVKELAPEALKLHDDHLKVEKQEILSLIQFRSLMTQNLDSLVNHLKLLKLLETKQSKEEAVKMIEYFESVEASLRKKSTPIETCVEWLFVRNVSDILKEVMGENVAEMTVDEKVEFFQRNFEMEGLVTSWLKFAVDLLFWEPKRLFP